MRAALAFLWLGLAAHRAAAAELHLGDDGKTLLATGTLDDAMAVRALKRAPKTVRRVILAFDEAHPSLEKKFRKTAAARKWTICGAACQKEVRPRMKDLVKIYPAEESFETVAMPNRGNGPLARRIKAEQARLAGLERRFSERGLDCRDAQSIRDFKDMVYLAFGHKKDPFDAPYSYHEATARCLCPETADAAGRGEENPKPSMAWARPLWNDCAERRRSADEASLFQEMYGLDAGRARALEACLCRDYWPGRRRR